MNSTLSKIPFWVIFYSEQMLLFELEYLTDQECFSEQAAFLFEKKTRKSSNKLKQKHLLYSGMIFFEKVVFHK